MSWAPLLIGFAVGEIALAAEYFFGDDKPDIKIKPGGIAPDNDRPGIDPTNRAPGVHGKGHPIVDDDDDDVPPDDDDHHSKYHDIDHHGQSSYVDKSNEVGAQTEWRLVPRGYSLLNMIRVRSKEIYVYWLRYPDRLLWNVVSALFVGDFYRRYRAQNRILEGLDRMMQHRFGLRLADAVNIYGSPSTKRRYRLLHPSPENMVFESPRRSPRVHYNYARRPRQ